MTIYYVCSFSGNDANSGSLEAPFKTIQCASNLAQPCDTIRVQPGIYRERISPPRGGLSNDTRIIYKSVVPKAAIVRGSTSWIPTQKYSDTIYYDSLDPSLFTDTSAIDGPNPFRVPFCVTPYNRNGAPEFKAGDKTADQNMVYSLGQVFVNDSMYKQCPYLKEIEGNPGSWYYDLSNNLLYVNLKQGIENSIIEITNQRRLFAPHIRQLRYINIDGFIFERCGNNYPNQFWTIPQNIQSGMIGTRSGKFWIIKNNIIQFASGIGIDWGNEGNATQDLETGNNGQATGSYGHIIQNNYICDNGAAGTASFMGKNFTFSNNIVEHNNNLLFYGKRRWESAGLKVHTPTNSVISNNIIRDNYCNGIWSDQGAGQNSVFKNNIILNNNGNGINFEIGTNTSGKVINNILDGNDYNICFATSGGCLIAHNLFLSSKKGDIHTYTFNRPDKWDSLNLEIFYNIFTTSSNYINLTTSNSISSRFLNYNQYAKDDKFTFMPDNKTTIPHKFLDWINRWSSFNNGTNSDEKSVLHENMISLQIQNDQYVLSFNNDSFKSQPLIQRSDIVDDYFGTLWNEENCKTGPFSSNKSNTIILCPTNF